MGDKHDRFSSRVHNNSNSDSNICTMDNRTYRISYKELEMLGETLVETLLGASAGDSLPALRRQAIKRGGDVKMHKLYENDNWNHALITYCHSNFPNREYSETERTYRVSRDNRCFQKDKIANSMFGNCLDGIDLGVRLDLYRWKVEKVVIED